MSECARKSQQRQQGKHPAGLAAFSAVGIIPVQMASGANPRVVDFRDPCGPELRFNLSPKIHFVMTRANARADEGNSDTRPECGHCCANHSRQGPFFAGMNQRDRRRRAVEDEDRHAVGTTDDQRQTGAPGDERIDPANSAGLIDNCNPIAMRLLGSRELAGITVR